MADSSIPVTPGSGTNVDGYTLDNSNFRQSVIIGDPVANVNIAPVDPVKGLTVQEFSIPADQMQSITGASGAAITVTIPAVAGKFAYITAIHIKEICAAAIATGSGTPTVITTTNLPGSLAWSFGYPVTAIGATMSEMIVVVSSPIKASAVNTAVTIVAPATTSVIWRINVHYYYST